MEGAEHSNELLEAQAHVWNHMLSLVNSSSLKCAVQLGIPDVIHKHGRPITVDELVAALPVNAAKAQCVFRLMRVLVQSGFFARQRVSENEPEEGYVLTNASRLLLKNEPLSVRPLLLLVLDPIVTQPWDHMSAWFQTEESTPFLTAHGRTFWDCAEHVSKLNHLFNEGMASDARLVTTVIIDKCKGVFKGLKSLVDVGGGTGTVAKALADAFPNLSCTVFDLPHVVVGLQGTHNLKYLGGDMFEAVPPADGILLKWILHDWNDEDCVKILGRCKEAITSYGKGGKVIIIDMIMENQKESDESNETQLFFDMLMMLLVSGRERNEKEWAKLFFNAGFSDYKITPALGLRSLIEVYP